ncbi:MAG: DUF4360 domain-containing protein [Dactylosporangium sp.]|nr:DUF4360 domain-containing protein [Dactylosporangium sp.]NNJ61445.1 DUF4360 domain-containing protein [Dactylosporangium sp.]
MEMLKSLVAAGAALALLTAPTLGADSASASEKVVATFAAVNGSGCPAGTVAVVAYPDNTGIILSYSSFYVQRGGDSAAAQGYQNCNLDIRMSVPAGFTFAVSRAVYHGYAFVLPGATAKLVAKYNFQGQAPTVSSHLINTVSPFDDNWTIIEEFPFANLQWAPCGADIILTDAFELRVQPYGPSSSPTDVSFVTANKSDHSIRTELNFVWAECHG